jgi:membrane protease YdiL (CAAX protease family)
MIVRSITMLSQSTDLVDTPLELTFWDVIIVLFSMGILLAFVASAATWGRLLWRGLRLFGPSALIPPRPRHQPFWNPFDFIVFYGVLFVASVLLASIFQAAGWLEIAGEVKANAPIAEAAEVSPAEQAEVSPVEVSLPEIAISSLAMLIATVVMIPLLSLRCNDVIGRMGLALRRFDVALGLRSALLILPPTMLMMGAVSMLKQYSHPVLDLLEVDESGGQPGLGAFALLFVTTVFVAPVVEEFWFRGLLQGGLQSVADSMKRRRNSLSATSMEDDANANEPSDNPYEPPQALIATETSIDSPGGMQSGDWVPVSVWPLVLASLVFALAHWGHGLAPIPLFFLSLGLGYLYRQTGSLIPSITVHFVLNGLTMTLTLCELMRGPA